MSKQRTTFGKLQRERDKKAKLAAKRERRLAGPSEEDEQPAAPAQEAVDEQALLTELAELHERYEDGRMSLEDFELRRDQLRQRLSVT